MSGHFIFYSCECVIMYDSGITNVAELITILLECYHNSSVFITVGYSHKSAHIIIGSIFGQSIYVTTIIIQSSEHNSLLVGCQISLYINI